MPNVNESRVKLDNTREDTDRPDELLDLLNLFPEAEGLLSYHARLKNERFDFTGAKDASNVFRGFSLSPLSSLYPLNISTFVQESKHHGNMGINAKNISTKVVVIRFLIFDNAENKKYSGNVKTDIRAMKTPPNLLITSGKEYITALWMLDRWMSGNDTMSVKHRLMEDLPEIKRNLDIRHYNNPAVFVPAVGIQRGGMLSYTPYLEILHENILSTKLPPKPPKIEVSPVIEAVVIPELVETPEPLPLPVEPIPEPVIEVPLTIEDLIEDEPETTELPPLPPVEVNEGVVYNGNKAEVWFQRQATIVQEKDGPIFKESKMEENE